MKRAIQIARIGAVLGIVVGYALLFTDEFMVAGYVTLASAALFAGCSLAIVIVDWSERRWRISLCAILIAMTVLAAALGTLVAVVRFRS